MRSEWPRVLRRATVCGFVALAGLAQIMLEEKRFQNISSR